MGLSRSRRDAKNGVKWKIQGSQDLCWLRALKLKLATTNSKGQTLSETRNIGRTTNNRDDK